MNLDFLKLDSLFFKQNVLSIVMKIVSCGDGIDVELSNNSNNEYLSNYLRYVVQVYFTSHKTPTRYHL